MNSIQTDEARTAEIKLDTKKATLGLFAGWGLPGYGTICQSRSYSRTCFFEDCARRKGNVMFQLV